jgi:hypothetical protein
MAIKEANKIIFVKAVAVLGGDNPPETLMG